MLPHASFHIFHYTVEPTNKGHFGANSFVPCREVVPISEGPLSEVPLYVNYKGDRVCYVSSVFAVQSRLPVNLFYIQNSRCNMYILRLSGYRNEEKTIIVGRLSE